MSVTETDATPAPKKSKLPLLLGLVLSLAGAAGGYLVLGDLLDARLNPVDAPVAATDAPAASQDVASMESYFVPIDPIIVNLNSESERLILRFAAQLDVAPGQVEAVSGSMPRIVDVLNGYLRAVEVSDIERPASLHALRGQMLRRVQIVTGPDAVHDLLITEFVLN